MTADEAEITGAQPIQEDLACSRCGYNLRGLLSTDRCPECANDIFDSIQRHRQMQAGIDLPLDQADRRWVGKLTIALWLILAGSAGLMLSFILYIISDPLSVAQIATLLGVFNVPRLFGVWLFGTSEPRARRRRDGSILRWIAAIDAATSIAYAAALLYSTLDTRYFPIAFVLIAVAGGSLFHWRLASICKRMNAKWLALTCKVLAVALPSSLMAQYWMTNGISVTPSLFVGGAWPYTPSISILSIVEVPVSLWNHLFSGNLILWMAGAVLAATSLWLIGLVGWRLWRITAKRGGTGHTNSVP